MGSNLNNTSASVQASRLFVGRESIKLFKRFIMKVLLYWTALVFPGAILWGSALQAQDAAGDRGIWSSRTVKMNVPSQSTAMKL